MTRRASSAPPRLTDRRRRKSSSRAHSRATRISMPAEFLHRRGDFNDLIRIVANEMGIDPALVEKDYWIMQSLYGLQQLGLQFQLKGGTSLSKGYGFIDRFSEDIDIRIEPDPALGVATGPNHNKPAQVDGRRAFYDHLSHTFRIVVIVAVA